MSVNDVEGGQLKALVQELLQEVSAALLTCLWHACCCSTGDSALAVSYVAAGARFETAACRFPGTFNTSSTTVCVAVLQQHAAPSWA